MRRLLAFFAFILFIGAALPAVAQSSYSYTPAPQLSQAPPYGQPRFDDRRGRRDRDDLRILSAWYGAGNRACNAEPAVERMCNNRSSCTVPVSNRLCGDPASYVVKVLTVTYQCRGRERTITRGEGGHLGLRCN